MKKSDLIKILNENKEEYLSGEFLAEQLGVSRTAIWKGINSLKADGFAIEAVRNKGYRFSDTNDVLNSEIIQKHLSNPKRFKIECYEVVSSTNGLIKERYQEEEGLVIVANTQEFGRGRLNRSFFSPKDTGVYFSVLLKPNLENNKMNFITSMAGIAVCRAVHNLLETDPKIKWVNDIYLNHRKVCGILTQGTFSLENNKVEHIILGIGINVYEPNGGFSDDLKEIAGSLKTQKQGGLRNQLIAEVLNEFFDLYEELNFEQIAKEYKILSNVLGKEIDVIDNGLIQRAEAVDIDENCGLVAQFENGEIRTLSSGEISVRKI